MLVCSPLPWFLRQGVPCRSVSTFLRQPARHVGRHDSLIIQQELSLRDGIKYPNSCFRCNFTNYYRLLTDYTCVPFIPILCFSRTLKAFEAALLSATNAKSLSMGMGMAVCGQVGQLISDAMGRVGRQGVVTMEESRTAEDHLYVVEGMQFDRGYISPYFVTDPERMVRLLCFSLGHANPKP